MEIDLEPGIGDSQDEVGMNLNSNENIRNTIYSILEMSEQEARGVLQKLNIELRGRIEAFEYVEELLLSYPEPEEVLGLYATVCPSLKEALPALSYLVSTDRNLLVSILGCLSSIPLNSLEEQEVLLSICRKYLSIVEDSDYPFVVRCIMYSLISKKNNDQLIFHSIRYHCRSLPFDIQFMTAEIVGKYLSSSNTLFNLYTASTRTSRTVSILDIMVLFNLTTSRNMPNLASALLHELIVSRKLKCKSILHIIEHPSLGVKYISELHNVSKRLLQDNPTCYTAGIAIGICSNMFSGFDVSKSEIMKLLVSICCRWTSKMIDLNADKAYLYSSALIIELAEAYPEELSAYGYYLEEITTRRRNPLPNIVIHRMTSALCKLQRHQISLGSSLIIFIQKALATFDINYRISALIAASHLLKERVFGEQNQSNELHDILTCVLRTISETLSQPKLGIALFDLLSYCCSNIPLQDAKDIYTLYLIPIAQKLGLFNETSSGEYLFSFKRYSKGIFTLCSKDSSLLLYNFWVCFLIYSKHLNHLERFQIPPKSTSFWLKQIDKSIVPSKISLNGSTSDFWDNWKGVYDCFWDSLHYANLVTGSLNVCDTDHDLSDITLGSYCECLVRLRHMKTMLLGISESKLKRKGIYAEFDMVKSSIFYLPRIGFAKILNILSENEYIELEPQLLVWILEYLQSGFGGGSWMINAREAVNNNSLKEGDVVQLCTLTRIRLHKQFLVSRENRQIRNQGVNVSITLTGLKLYLEIILELLESQKKQMIVCLLHGCDHRESSINCKSAILGLYEQFKDYSAITEDAVVALLCLDICCKLTRGLRISHCLALVYLQRIYVLYISDNLSYTCKSSIVHPNSVLQRNLACRCLPRLFDDISSSLMHLFEMSHKTVYTDVGKYFLENCILLIDDESYPIVFFRILGALKSMSDNDLTVHPQMSTIVFDNCSWFYNVILLSSVISLCKYDLTRDAKENSFDGFKNCLLMSYLCLYVCQPKETGDFHPLYLESIVYILKACLWIIELLKSKIQECLKLISSINTTFSGSDISIPLMVCYESVSLVNDLYVSLKKVKQSEKLVSKSIRKSISTYIPRIVKSTETFSGFFFKLISVHQLEFDKNKSCAFIKNELEHLLKKLVVNDSEKLFFLESKNENLLFQMGNMDIDPNPETFLNHFDQQCSFIFPQ